MDTPLAAVEAIAIRTGRRAPMRELQEIEASEGGGLAGDVPAAGHRGVTLISSPQWRETTAQLGVELPWHTRRANILLDAPRLGPWIGRTVRIGEVVIEITGETLPCGLMDELSPGLRTALAPDARGGVHGRILRGGVIRVGDKVVAHEASPASA